MAWIESHQELARHPKTRKLARILGVSIPTVIGHLHLLWWWAMDYAQEGTLERYDDSDIADAAMWEGDPTEFLQALCTAGFVDVDESGIYSIHDWHDYAGRLMEQRQHAAQQKRRHRELYNNKALVQAIRDRDKDRCRYCGRLVNWRNRKGPDGATYDYIDPDGPTSFENVVVACRACNAGKNQRTPEEAGYTLLQPPNRYLQKSGQNQVITQPVSTQTVPNQTVPNQTEHNQTVKIDTHAPGGASAQPQNPSDQPADQSGEQRKRAKTQKQDELFARFWAAYPKKRSKGQAEKAWAKLQPDEQLIETMLAAIERAKKSEEWRKENGRYIPYPATWLNGKRWEDDYPVETEVKADDQRGQYSGANSSKPINLDKFLWQGT